MVAVNPGVVFPTKKTSEFLENPRLHFWLQERNLTGEGTMETHLFTKYQSYQNFSRHSTR